MNDVDDDNRTGECRDKRMRPVMVIMVVIVLEPAAIWPRGRRARLEVVERRRVSDRTLERRSLSLSLCC